MWSAKYWLHPQVQSTWWSCTLLANSILWHVWWFWFNIITSSHPVILFCTIVSFKSIIDTIDYREHQQVAIFQDIDMSSLSNNVLVYMLFLELCKSILCHNFRIEISSSHGPMTGVCFRIFYYYYNIPQAFHDRRSYVAPWLVCSALLICTFYSVTTRLALVQPLTINPHHSGSSCSVSIANAITDLMILMSGFHAWLLDSLVPFIFPGLSPSISDRLLKLGPVTSISMWCCLIYYVRWSRKWGTVLYLMLYLHRLLSL